MELLIAAGVIAGFVALTRKIIRSARGARHRPSPLAEQQRAEQQRRLAAARRARAVAAQLQMALQQVTQAPDFRRAASFAAHASCVSLALRHRLFRAFRRKLLTHYSTRLAAGENPEVLLESLRALVQGLGVSNFEADYIAGEAGRLIERQQTAPTTTFQQRVTQLQRDYDQRAAAIRAIANIDEETRARMLETEETRFREGIMSLSERPDALN